jgi:hypothetical protein
MLEFIEFFNKKSKIFVKYHTYKAWVHYYTYREMIKYAFTIPAVCCVGGLARTQLHRRALLVSTKKSCLGDSGGGQGERQVWEMPSSLKNKLNKYEHEDNIVIHDEKVEQLIQWWDPKYTQVIIGLGETNPRVIFELDYIRIMYDRPPINATRRILVRNNITRLIETETLTESEYNFLVDVLVYYGCVHSES